jgi:hypothetical protein
MMRSGLRGRSIHCVRHGLAENARYSQVDHLYAQLVRDALEILDRYRAPLAKRDHVKSLDDREELLRRVHAALEPLKFKGSERRHDVTEILRRIDEAHGRAP